MALRPVINAEVKINFGRGDVIVYTNPDGVYQYDLKITQDNYNLLPQQFEITTTMAGYIEDQKTFQLPEYSNAVENGIINDILIQEDPTTQNILVTARVVDSSNDAAIRYATIQLSGQRESDEIFLMGGVTNASGGLDAARGFDITEAQYNSLKSITLNLSRSGYQPKTVVLMPLPSFDNALVSHIDFGTIQLIAI